MTDPVEPRCDCMECRVRAALCGGRVDAPFELDINEAAKVLGNVLAECLAHKSSREAKNFAAALLDHRKRWLKHPRVLAQQPAAGHA